MNIQDKETRRLFVVIIITICLQFFSLIRNSITASLFGTSVEMDAYNVSFNLTTFLFSFFGSAVTTVLIPNITEKKTFSKGVNSFITCLFILSIIVSILGIIFNKELISLITGNQSEYFIDLSSSLLSILLLGNVFSFILGVNSAIFQVRNRFIMLKFTQLISYIYIVLMLGFIISNNIYQYAIVITTANILNLILQLYYLKKENIIFKINLSIKDKEFIQMLKNLLPIFLSTGLYQFSLMINTAISSRLGDGQVSILSYSNQIVTMVNTLILGNVILFIYPKLAAQIKKSINYAKDKLLDYLLLVFFIMILILLIFILAGKESIALIYERGAFTKQTTSIVYYVTFLYFIVLPLNATRDLFYKFFYANNDTYTPFKNSIKVSVLNIVLSVIFSYFWGIYGIALGTSISTIISLGMIIKNFKKRYNTKFNKKFIQELLKIVTSFVITLVLTNIITHTLKGVPLIVYIIETFVISFTLFILVLAIIRSRVFNIKL
jgi:putative peptidoglycan lipid II flippase